MSGGDGTNSKFTVPAIGSQAQGDNDEGMSEIQHSLCMQCGGEGTTRMLMTKIPFFREVIISSFECENPECEWTNNQVLFGGELQEQGCRFELVVDNKDDLNRQIIKSDYASIEFPDIEFEIPPKTQQGEITTIEGLLSTAAERLGYDQAARMQADPQLGAAIAGVILKLSNMAGGEVLPFKLVVDDPSGNSFVENPHAPAKDRRLSTAHYKRTPEQDRLLGLQPGGEYGGVPPAENGGTVAAAAPAEGAEGAPAEGLLSLAGDNFLKKETARFEDYCPNCRHLGETLMCMADIPHFKEVIIMAFNCEACGYKSNEVKGGGEVPPKGTLHTLRATQQEDFSRDILKSDSCSIAIPELELELEMGTLGSVYTTLEGLLEKMRNNLSDGNPFASGDSTTEHHGREGPTQAKKLDELRAGERFPFTLQLRDPLGNSFIGALHTDNPEDDPQLTVEEYERTHDELEQLGLNDIKTEGYEVGHSGDKPAQQHVKPTQHRVGADHPTRFTKGVQDATLCVPEIEEKKKQDMTSPPSATGDAGASP